MTDMVYGSVPATAGDPVLPRWWRTIDKLALSCIFFLFGIGLLLGLAASAPLATRNGLEPFHYVLRQGVFGFVSLSALVAISMLSPKAIRRLSLIGALGAFVAVILLPIFGTDFGKGATRWYSLGFASLQPSEFLKPFFAVVVAWLMAAGQQENGPPGMRIALGLLFVVVGFLAMQPDFGQSALVVVTWMSMYFVSGAPIAFLVILLGIVVVCGTFAYHNSEHFARRIDGFLTDDIDPRTQIGYATNAIKEGGLFGTGVGEGQVKWSLPDAHTDFIIAVAAEEYGLLLVMAIIGLFSIVVVRSMLRLVKERDPFIRLAATGLATAFGAQAMINMGVAVRLLPSKGMTLPFVSYGGSSLLAAGITVGMLLALTRTRPQGGIGDILLRRGRI